jgi:hypothetical protein
VKDDCASYCTAYLWIVPAKVEGTWKLPQGELTIKQAFQTFSGSIRSGGKTVPISDGKLNGEHISFTAGGVKYSGNVTGSAINGESGKGKWSATRAGG